MQLQQSSKGKINRYIKIRNSYRKGKRLSYQFVGMKTMIETVNGRTTINVTLQVETIGLDEVVSVLILRRYNGKACERLFGFVSQAWA